VSLGKVRRVRGFLPLKVREMLRACVGLIFVSIYGLVHWMVV
jgi:hypothetical protein